MKGAGEIIRTIAAACILASFFGCDSLPDVQQSLPPDAEIYDVYSAALEDIFGNLPEDHVLNVSNRFTEKGLAPVGLERNFSVSFRYELTDESILQADFDARDPEAFREKYPGFTGLVTLSKVDFNDLHNQATVNLDFTMCPLCGFGETVVLQKQSQKWKVIKRETGWES